MAMRPPQIRYLTEGKALGAEINKGFAATWNWLLAWVNFFKGGNGCKIVNTGSGHPRLDVLIEGRDGVDVKCDGDGKPYVISLSDDGGGGGDDSGGGGQYIPAITAIPLPDGTHILVDGAEIAVIPHGHTPKITATKDDKVATIYADGEELCTIRDGEDADEAGERQPGEVVTGVTFTVENGKLVAKVTKQTVTAVWGAVSEETEDVCDVEDVTVVTGESYDSSSHKFENTRKLVKVLGAQDTDGQTPFTATPHSAE